MTDNVEMSGEPNLDESKKINSLIQAHLYEKMQRKDIRTKSLESEILKDQKFLTKTPAKGTAMFSSMETKVRDF